MTAMHRHVLPNRRFVETRKLSAPNGQIIHLSVGYDTEGPVRPYEVFYSAGLKSGSDLEYHMQDMCVLISLLLQYGLPPDAIAHSLSKTERPTGDIGFATLTGFVLEEIAKPPEWTADLLGDPIIEAVPDIKGTAPVPLVWQTIASAPKDREILIFHADWPAAYVARWGQIDDASDDDDPSFGWCLADSIGPGVSYDVIGYTEDKMPTHWCDLPVACDDETDPSDLSQRGGKAS